MMTSYRKEALQETLLLMCAGETPTERHYRAAAVAHGVKARTARRVAKDLFDLPSRDAAGLSARAALDSLVGLDPRVVFQTEPTGSGWWPDMDVLGALAAQPTLIAAHEMLQVSGRPVLPTSSSAVDSRRA